MVAVSAVALATCLATFLLNWSLNLGDRIQRELRAYGSNIIILPQGDSLPVIAGNEEFGILNSDAYFNISDMDGLKTIFWKNQILAVAPLLSERVSYESSDVLLAGTEFGDNDKLRSLPEVSPYLHLRGRWPAGNSDVVCGEELCRQFGWKRDRTIVLSSGEKTQTFRITGTVSSGGVEDKQLFARLEAVQELTGHSGRFKQLLVSALITPPNRLFLRYQRNPDSLTPQELERYSCTPYVTLVAEDIAKVFPGSESRIVKQITQTEEKIVKKMNWLMILVTFAGLVASSLTMTSTTTAMILERRKELALMKAIGSNNGFLFFYLFSEILILGAVGSLIGYGAGSVLSVSLSHSLFQTIFQVKWVVLPLVTLIGIMIILFGSLWPLRQAMTLDPAPALKDL